MKIIQLLCGIRKPSFPSEQHLRMFQLMAWLLADGTNDKQIFDDAYCAFAALGIKYIIAHDVITARKANELLSPLNAAISRAKNADFIRFFNTLFDGTRSFSSVVDGSSTIAWNVNSNQYARRDSLNCYVECCLRVAISGQVRPIKEKAKTLHRIKASQESLRLDLDTLLTSNRSRLAFLYVASIDTPLLVFEGGLEGLWTQSQRLASQKEKLIQYFQRCAYVQNVLARGQDLRASDIIEWAKAEAEAPPHLVPLADAEIAAIEEFEGR